MLEERASERERVNERKRERERESKDANLKMQSWKKEKTLYNYS